MKPQEGFDIGRRRVVSGIAGAVLGAVLPAEPAMSRATVLPDVQLTNRDGRSARFVSEVWRDRTALINFVFTTCTSFCGMQSALLAEVQRKLGDKVGSRIVLVSLTLDPVNDTPQRLAEFSAPFAPRNDWWWLTGQIGNVFRLLDALQVNRGNPAEHGPLWIYGRVGTPAQLVGFPKAEHLIARLNT